MNSVDTVWVRIKNLLIRHRAINNAIISDKFTGTVLQRLHSRATELSNQIHKLQVLFMQMMSPEF